jgi:GDPmannose 4,6-dehydratase
MKYKKKKTALIFGITGQDGSYLSKLLISKDYIVHGVKRKSSSLNTSRIDDLYVDPHKSKNFFLHYGDLVDTNSINQVISKVNPDEIYNLAAQSHVAVSFEIPEYTANVDALGTLRILEAIKSNKSKKIKFYQAGTSEMFGSSPPPQDEQTKFLPNSPYAVSKLFSYYLTINYRESYDIFASNGILFNHESPNRGDTFVTKKIINGLVRIKYEMLDCVYLGNLYSKRDWGHAKDYVEAMWLVLQYKKPLDIVISSDKQYSVKQFINYVCKYLELDAIWTGKGLNEKLTYKKKAIIKIDKKYFRPKEVDSLLGRSAKARKILKWKPKYDIHSLIDDMVKHEIGNLKIEKR